MSEIKRINESESYNTTVGWLDDFLKKMAKDLPPSPIGQTTASKEKFATIEEKMNDIKSRVGFASVDSIKKESSSEIVTASEKKCKCGNAKCTCNKQGERQKAACGIQTASRNIQRDNSLHAVWALRHRITGNMQHAVHFLPFCLK